MVTHHLKPLSCLGVLEAMHNTRGPKRGQEITSHDAMHLYIIRVVYTTPVFNTHDSYYDIQFVTVCKVLT